MQVQDGASPELVTLKGQQRHGWFFRLLGKRAVVAYRGEGLKNQEDRMRVSGVTGAQEVSLLPPGSTGKSWSGGFQLDVEGVWERDSPERGRGGCGESSGAGGTRAPDCYLPAGL